MGNEPRLNKVIQLLEEGKHVFGSFAGSGNVEEAVYYGNSNYDFVVFEMEHSGFDFPGLATSLQFLLNRGRILQKGSLQPDPVPFVRIPANSREKNDWLIKQSLDYGVYGIIVPHLSTVDEALHAIGACRYPQARGAKDFEPKGHRGTGPTNVLRYWGISADEYYQRSDLWPLDPKGEIVLMPLIEDYEGVQNLPAILKAAQGGMGIIFVGEVDLATSMGLFGQCEGMGKAAHPEIEDALKRVLAVCKDNNVPCACLTNPANIQKRIEMGFRVLFAGPQRTAAGLDTGRKIASTGR